MQKLLLFLAFPIIWNIPHLALDLNSRPLSSLVCQTSCFTTTPRLPSIRNPKFSTIWLISHFLNFQLETKKFTAKSCKYHWHSWVDNFLIASMRILTPNFTIYRCIIYFNRIVTFFTAISRNFYPTYDCLDVLYL